MEVVDRHEKALNIEPEQPLVLTKKIPAKAVRKHFLIGLAILAPGLFLAGVLVGRLSLTSAPSGDELRRWIAEQARHEKEQEEKELARIPILSHDELKETGDLHIANQDQKQGTDAKKKKIVKKKRPTKKVVRKQKTTAPRAHDKEKERVFTIQVAAFKNVGNAERMLVRLQEAGIKARLGKKKSAAGSILFTVRTGRYKTRQEPKLDIKKIKNLGYLTPMVIKLKKDN